MLCVLFQCLTNAADGVRLAARIVDTPCSEMNTDDFLEASFSPHKNVLGFFFLLKMAISHVFSHHL